MRCSFLSTKTEAYQSSPSNIFNMCLHVILQFKCLVLTKTSIPYISRIDAQQLSLHFIYSQPRIQRHDRLSQNSSVITQISVVSQIFGLLWDNYRFLVYNTGVVTQWRYKVVDWRYILDRHIPLFVTTFSCIFSKFI